MKTQSQSKSAGEKRTETEDTLLLVSFFRFRFCLVFLCASRIPREPWIPAILERKAGCGSRGDNTGAVIDVDDVLMV